MQLTIFNLNHSSGACHSDPWFSVDGTATLDDEQVLEMRFLLDRLDCAQGPFVPLEDGSFMALTRQLQSQLQRLALVSEPHRAGVASMRSARRHWMRYWKRPAPSRRMRPESVMSPASAPPKAGHRSFPGACRRSCGISRSTASSGPHASPAGVPAPASPTWASARPRPSPSSDF